MYKKAHPAALTSPKKVLIMEDDEMTRDILSKIISNYFMCEVNVATSSNEARSYISARSYDLFIIGNSDSASMPRDIIEKIKEQFRNTPLIVVLGDCTDNDISLLREKGIDKIIYKPLKLTSFLEIVAGAFLEREQIYNFA